MLTLFKPYGNIMKESALFGDIVNVVGVENPPGPERDAEIREKLRTCDILKADVDIQVNSEFVENAPNLRAVVCASIGVDYVNIPEMTQEGILVANNPTFCIEAVAEYVIGLMFSIVRRIPKGVSGVLDGNWLSRYDCRGVEIRNRTIGVLGFGNIGREVARMAIGLGMNVLAYDAYMNEEKAKEIGARPVDLDTLIRESDVITVHVPLLPSTRGMIDKTAIEKMKDGVYIINSARGGIVNEQDLVDACLSGKVAGAAMDVLTKEPAETDNPLLNHVYDNILVTPHMAFNTAEAAEHINKLYREQLIAISEGKEPPAVINKEVLNSPRVREWLK